MEVVEEVVEVVEVVVVEVVVEVGGTLVDVVVVVDVELPPSDTVIVQLPLEKYP